MKPLLRIVASMRSKPSRILERFPRPPFKHAAALHGVEGCVEPCRCILGAFDRDVARRQRRAREAAERRRAVVSAGSIDTRLPHTTCPPSNANTAPSQTLVPGHLCQL